VSASQLTVIVHLQHRLASGMLTVEEPPNLTKSCVTQLWCIQRSLLLAVLLQGREVQLRLVQQRQKAAARAINAKASRNVSKAKGKKAKKTAAAMADW
jgi:hypothetical protein